jgi:hypothetical protein
MDVTDVPLKRLLSICPHGFPSGDLPPILPLLLLDRNWGKFPGRSPDGDVRTLGEVTLFKGMPEASILEA